MGTKGGNPIELIKITELSNMLGLSSRTLRYYEQVGLLESTRPDFEKYRYYDEENVERLKQIIVLRKMQISIRDIQRIYESEDMCILVEAFVRRLNEIDKEVNALGELRQVVNGFLQKMLKNGIKKISALPLLYEEMSRQLEISTEEKGISIEKLHTIEKRLRKPAEVRIVKLPEARMLCSKRQASSVSDIDGFWEFLDRNGALNEPAEHSLFEFQDEDGQMVMLVKKTARLQDSDFMNYFFYGGLYAVSRAFADEALDTFLLSVVESFDENKFYQVDYSKQGRLVLFESVLSSDRRRDMVDVLVPIVARVPDMSCFGKTKLVTRATIAEIERENPILWQRDVTRFSPIEHPFYKINADGITEFVAYISVRTLSTGIQVKIPFRVDITFKVDEASALYGYGADEGSIRIDFGGSYFGVNMGNNPDQRRSLEAIRFTEPLIGSETELPKLGRITPNEYNALTWIVGEKHFAVIINGEIRYCVKDMPYMKTTPHLLKSDTIIIGSNGQGKRFLKSVKVSQLRQSPRLKIKGGKLTMSAKQSNNAIPNIHPVITMHYGENYWFNGCARYVMECLDQPDYSYGFFAGLTGDNFTQIYGKNKFLGDSATDYIIKEQGGTYIEDLFDKIGYACTYVPNRKLKGNREMYLQTLMAYIDKDVPVIRYHWFWSVIVGYEDFGKTLLVMNSDKTEPEKIPFEEIFNLTDPHSDQEADEYGYGWFFVGDKTREVPLADVYRTAIGDILPRLLIDNESFCFGANAFRTWANDIERGKFDAMKPESFDDWPLYTNFVCNLATNSGCGHDFLIKASELNPDLAFLSEVMRLYARTGEMWNNQGGEDLEALGGGFNITLGALQDKERRAKIVKKLREFASTTDKIIALFRANTDEDGNLHPIQIDLTAAADIKYFTTVNVTDWVKSPFVPNFNGKVKVGKDVNGKSIKYWYIDSLQGKWSTVYSTIENVKQGEKVRLLLWAKFHDGGHHELINWITQVDWEKHVEIYMNECKPYMLGKRGDYCLFTAIYTAVEDGTVQLSISANNVIVSLYPAVESDMQAMLEAEQLEKQPWSITKCYKEAFPKCRFVGMKYKNKDRVDGMFGAYWEEWHEKGRFAVLEKLLTDDFRKAYPETEAYVGLMKNKYGAPDDYFEYWIGMFLPADCTVPEGFSYIDIQHDAAGICWIKGPEWLVYCHEGECYNEIVKGGMTILSESDDGCYMFERYACPRFTAPDENGEVILDLGFFVEKGDKVKQITELKSGGDANDKL